MKTTTMIYKMRDTMQNPAPFIFSDTVYVKMKEGWLLLNLNTRKNHRKKQKGGQSDEQKDPKCTNRAQLFF